MITLLRETMTLTGLGLSGIPRRPWESAVIVVSVALTVSVLLAALAMERGFRQTIDGSASAGVIVAMRTGANSELDSVVPLEQSRVLETAPGVEIVSPESFATVDGTRKESRARVNLPLRGLGPNGPALRTDFRLTAGRMFAPGSNEIIAGEGAAREFDGFTIGREVAFGSTRWRVVGLFSAPGTVFDSEIWGDLATVQDHFGRGSAVQSVRLRLTTGASLESLKAWIGRDPRLRLDVIDEQEYFALQSRELSVVILWLGWPLAIGMAIGALAGAICVTSASVQARATEIATLRAIGFRGAGAFVATLTECSCLAALGGILGSIGSYLLFDGVKATTLGSNFSQVAFEFAVTPQNLIAAIALAVGIGLVGGFVPALRSAAAPITNVHGRAT